MEDYEIVQKIEKLREERGWTTYRLSEQAGIPQSTIFNMRARGTLPSITTLGCLCAAFGITLAEFFSDEGEEGSLKEDERRLLACYRQLSYKNKSAVRTLAENLK